MDLDDTGFPKKGRHSVGVTRRYCGQLGKQDNCQVAVTLSVANHTASLPVAYRLYLPEEWAADADRRAKAGVPATVSFKSGQTVLQTTAAIARKFQKYMLVRTLMSAITGLGVWGFASLAGLQLAREWGVIAFVLNYIPFIGPLVATALPALFAVAQFESWQMPVIVFAGLYGLQFLTGSYLEPLIAGAALSASPFLVLFAVFFGTFLWGIPGAFIGVPILIALVTICEHVPSLRWAAILLSGQKSGAR